LFLLDLIPATYITLLLHRFLIQQLRWPRWVGLHFRIFVLFCSEFWAEFKKFVRFVLRKWTKRRYYSQHRSTARRAWGRAGYSPFEKRRPCKGRVQFCLVLCLVEF
jgi:hypothetical protein